MAPPSTPLAPAAGLLPPLGPVASPPALSAPAPLPLVAPVFFVAPVPLVAPLPSAPPSPASLPPPLDGSIRSVEEPQAQVSQVAVTKARATRAAWRMAKMLRNASCEELAGVHVSVGTEAPSYEARLPIAHLLTPR